MTWHQTWRFALESITARKLRSLLTGLGIFIGTAAVIVTFGLGLGAQQQVSAQISQLGTNLLIVSPGSSTTAGIRGGRGSATTLTRTDAAVLSDSSVAPDVARVAPVTTTSVSVSAGSTTWTTSVVGTNADWYLVRARTMSSGRFLSNSDVSDTARVAVLGATTATELFGSERNALGATVTVSGQQLSVIGVLAATGSSGTSDEDDQILIPGATYTRVFATNPQAVSSIYLQAADKDSVSAAYQETYAALSTRHNVATSDFSISSQQSLVETATATTKTLTILLGSVAAISLLVGGIGVANIMVVSVTERTREIGLRKALGATPGTIRAQFLTEAALLSALGGLAGLGVAAVLAWTLPRVADVPVVLSGAACAGAVGTSIAIGLIFGVYPAARAARLSPIDALRGD